MTEGVKSARLTIDDILRANGGAGKGFDLLRLGLALLILVSHTSGLMGHNGTTAWLTELIFGAPTPTAAPPVLPTVPGQVLPGQGAPAHGAGMTSLSGPFIRALVPMFFALSGFLVTGSALRTRSLIRFLGLRALRIVPALFVEVALSAFLIGAVFTTLPLRDYFIHPMFFRYFYNIAGIVQFRLPGVFEENSMNAVNANLWTLPYELESYVLMSAVILLGLLHRRLIATLLFLAITAGFLVANIVYGFESEIVVYSGRSLVYYFLCGLMIYLWRDQIPFSWFLFAVCFIAAYFLLKGAHTAFIVPLLLTYVTIFIGMMNLPQFRLLKSGDYSYGIYLYSFPVTQAMLRILPRDLLSFWPFALSVSLATCAFAFFSWHAIEKHCLKLKKYISPSSAKITTELHPAVAAS